MKSILQKLEESPSIAKFEIVEDELGKRTTISMNPRYFFFKKSEEVSLDENGTTDFSTLETKDRHYLTFDVRDKSNNKQIPIIEHIKSKSDNKTYKEIIPPPILKAGEIVDDTLYFNPKYDGHICPVMYNSKHNMLELIRDNYTRMNSIGFIDYMSIMQFKDGTNYININHTEVSYNQKTDKLFYSKDDRYSLKLRGDNGTTSLVKNGRLCMSHKSICNFFGIIAGSQLFTMKRDYHKEYGVFQDLFCELFFENFTGRYEDYLDSKLSRFYLRNPVPLTYLYRVKRNRKLNQLPWNEQQLAQIYDNPQTHFIDSQTILSEQEKKDIQNTRANINRYLRKGDTKKATDACFYGFSYPKAFRRLMLKTNPMQFDKNTYNLLDKIVKDKGVNNALNYFSVNDKPNIFILEQTHALSAIALGFKANKIITKLNDEHFKFDNSRIIQDALKMREELLDMKIDIDIDERDIFKYHDLISKSYNTVMEAKKSAELELFKTVDTSEQLPSFSHGEWTIRSPKNAFELLEVGNEMNHCVGSYMSDFFYRRLEICLIEKNGKYHACLEIIDNTMIQAKLSNNRYVADDKETLQLVFGWAKTNGIEVATSDCGCKKSKHLSLLPPCEERLALFKDLDVDAYEEKATNDGDFRIILDELSLAGF